MVKYLKWDQSHEARSCWDFHIAADIFQKSIWAVVHLMTQELLYRSQTRGEQREISQTRSLAIHDQTFTSISIREICILR